MIVSQLSRYCDVISNRLLRHQQDEDRACKARERCVNIVVFSSFMDSLCRVRNIIMYVLLWQTISALTRVLFLCLFPSLLRNSGNNYQITLSWALKQNVTRAHTLLSINNDMVHTIFSFGVSRVGELFRILSSQSNLKQRNVPSVWFAF